MIYIYSSKYVCMCDMFNAAVNVLRMRFIVDVMMLGEIRCAHTPAYTYAGASNVFYTYFVDLNNSTR